MQIETKRLIISLLSNDEMKKLIDSEENQDMKQAYTQMLDGCIKSPENRIWSAIWAIKLKDTSDIAIGDLSFKGLGTDGMVEIGYGIKKEFEGKGYMTEAVTAISTWASQQEGVNSVEAETDVNNIASQRVLQKSGYIPNGIIGAEGPRYVWKGEVSKSNKN
jgi:ribosomal-protein-alanine N-acetyltransferase